jgi:hypothetical protein
MKNGLFKVLYKTTLICIVICTVSCKKIFDLKPTDQVDATNAYQNIYDANAAVIGIYGQLMTIADRYIVLNELRADLMSPTANADANLKALNTHSETTDNPWADPKPWYKIILSCNDAMYHFNDMLATGKLKPVDYQSRYSDIGTLRCWLYLQLGIQYGTIPYVTDPISNLTDLNDATKFPRVTLDQLIPKLAAFMNDPARYLAAYPATDPITGSASSALNTTLGDATIDAGTGNTALFFINKYAFLGDINLWAGNYNAASVAYKYLGEFGQTFNAVSSFQSFEKFKVCYDTYTITYNNASELQLNDSPTSGWREIFAEPTYTTNSDCEYVWRIPFNTSFAPANPLINLFSNQGGSYLLTASQAIINNWNSQVQTSGYPYDARGRLSVRTLNGQPVIMKHLYYYLDPNTFLPVNVTQKSGVFLLYRGTAIQQHFAESACNDNQLKVAYALLNVGIQSVFSTKPLPADVTNTEQSFLPPPYDFDARSGGPQGYHQDWYREVGTRTRAGLLPLPTSYYAAGADKTLLENAIIDDSARELAFEGYRWGDLVRIARRRGDPSFLANKVYNKLLLEGNPAAATVQAKLMDPNGWYMPFKL